MSINLNSIDVVLEKGTVLYHGTIESFDIRNISVNLYDNILWTTDDIMIARSYIPVRGSYFSTSVRSLMLDQEHANIRKQLGLNDAIKLKAFKIQEKSLAQEKYWYEKLQEYETIYKKNKNIEDIDFFDQWIDTENRYKEAKKNLLFYDTLIIKFIITKMKTFGYECSNEYFRKIYTDKNGYLIKNDTREVGQVIQLTCKKDFIFYNYAYKREGDLMNLDYHKVNLFRKIEQKGYDGIIINDFAQTEYHGNYGHISYGFFKDSIKYLKVKKLRNMTHPHDHEWKN